MHARLCNIEVKAVGHFNLVQKIFLMSIYFKLCSISLLITIKIISCRDIKASSRLLVKVRLIRITNLYSAVIIFMQGKYRYSLVLMRSIPYFSPQILYTDSNSKLIHQWVLYLLGIRRRRRKKKTLYFIVHNRKY